MFICCCPTALASIDSVPLLTPAYKMSLASLYKPHLGARGLRRRPYLLQTRLKIDRVFLELHIMHTLGEAYKQTEVRIALLPAFVDEDPW